MIRVQRLTLNDSRLMIIELHGTGIINWENCQVLG